MSEILKTNLEALKKRYPELYQRIHSVKIDQSNLFLRKGKGGEPVLGVWTASGQEGILDDPCDPVGAAQRLLSPIPLNAKLIVSLGMGFGYHLLPLLKRPGWERLWVIEPQLVILVAAIHCVDLSPLFLDERVNFMVEEADPVKAVNLLTGSHFDFRTDDEARMVILPDCYVIEHPGSISFSRDYHQKVVERLKTVIASSEKNRRTLELFSVVWMENIFANIGLFLHHKGTGILHDQFKGIPAVIIGAGPSLDKNIHQLKGQEERVLLIAVDTALPTLRRAGIKPHLVVSIDAGEDNLKDFEGASLEDSLLILSPVVDSRIPPLCERRLLLRYSYPLVLWVERLLESSLGVSLVSGSVSTAAFDLAWRMGCSPIVFVGQDMAYTDDATHSRIAAPSDYKDISRFSTMEGALRLRQDVIDAEWTEDFEGRPIKSSRAMMGWRDWLQDRIRFLGIEVVNCTEGGLPINGAKSVPLSDFLETAGPERNLSEMVKRIGDRRRRPPLDLLKRGLKRLAEEAFSFLEAYPKAGDRVLAGREHLAIAVLWEKAALSEKDFLEHVERLAEAALAARRRL